MSRILVAFFAGVGVTSLAFVVFEDRREVQTSDEAQAAMTRNGSNTAPSSADRAADLIVDERVPQVEALSEPQTATATDSGEPPVPVNSEQTEVVGGVRLVSVPALPGMSSYEVKVPARIPLPPRSVEQLAAEERDSRWAAGMEGFLYSSVSSIISAPVDSIEAECRKTWCGIVVDATEPMSSRTQHSIRGQLQEAVNAAESDSLSSGTGGPYGNQFTAFYFRFDR